MGLPPDAEVIINILRSRPTFLMVGTVEPRKGCAPVLDAFEHLWSKGIESNLVLVGKQGWMMDKLAERLNNHPEMGRQFFWLRGISDEFLEAIYGAAVCLFAASEGEGFGLPLIEAAQQGLPVIARDIPVFREVAGSCAHYFSANNGAELASEIENWLSLYKDGKHPRSTDMHHLTWDQSARRYVQLLFEGGWDIEWRLHDKIRAVVSADC
jgi:glycosyltransferase involved in cell wall biosynthesis